MLSTSQLDVPIQKGDVTATLFVLVGDRCVDFMSMPLAETGSNVRIKAHGAFDPGLRRFEEELRPVRLEKGTEFEAAVGQLFFFLGFHVDPLSAGKRLQDAADHLGSCHGILRRPGRSSVRSGHRTEGENWASSSLARRTCVASFLTAK